MCLSAISHTATYERIKYLFACFILSDKVVHIFSLPGQSPGRAIVLLPAVASALVLALAAALAAASALAKY